MSRASRKRDSGSRDDGADSLRVWRLRSYMDHLEDLGYDLDGGGPPVREPVDDADAPPPTVIQRAG